MVEESLFSVLSIFKTIIHNGNTMNFVFLRKHQGNLKDQCLDCKKKKKNISTMFKLLNSKNQNNFQNILDSIPLQKKELHSQASFVQRGVTL